MEPLGQGDGSPAFIGSSPAIRKARELIERAKDLGVPVAVVGETGTGKEIVAQLLHARSCRGRQGDFVPVNCTIPLASIAESRLFGHEAGAFTGADRAHRGFFEQAHRGTLFLDEFVELPETVQPMLLRVLEDGLIRRVRGERAIPVDVRVVVSSKRPLDRLCREGRVREDLYHRLGGLEILLAPLRERREDIPLLVDHFNRSWAMHLGRPALEIGPEARELLARFDWPGNVRELRTEIHLAFLNCPEGVLPAERLSEKIRERAGTRRRGRPPLDAKECARRAREAIVRSNGCMAKAARSLGLSRATLYRWIRMDSEKIPDRNSPLEPSSSQQMPGTS